MLLIKSGGVAQSVEQRTENPCVAGSIPAPATTFPLILDINQTLYFKFLYGCYCIKHDFAI